MGYCNTCPRLYFEDIDKKVKRSSPKSKQNQNNYNNIINSNPNNNKTIINNKENYISNVKIIIFIEQNSKNKEISFVFIRNKTFRIYKYQIFFRYNRCNK